MGGKNLQLVTLYIPDNGNYLNCILKKQIQLSSQKINSYNHLIPNMKQTYFIFHIVFVYSFDTVLTLKQLCLKYM